MEKLSEKPWDIFISHASEDKDTLVRPVAHALSAFGARVWYDEFTLDVGDSLSCSIDHGLSQSRFGLIVLSPSFFAKAWPEYELRGLTAKELGREKVILPIWHNVSREEVLKYSPPLADKMALNSKDKEPVVIALYILDIIRPDLFSKLHKRAAYLALPKVKKKVSIKKIVSAPIRHKELPLDLIGRIRLIRAALWGGCTHSMDYWLDGFKRDAHPSKEISWWEHVASAYVEYVKITRLKRGQHEHVFNTVFGICSGDSRRQLKKYLDHLPKDAYKVLSDICGYRHPVYDIKEEFPREMDELSPEDTDAMSKIDIRK
ncbi:MAG: toll/interleukin-1 receptor domain-containing protein [Nitrospirae bacterium]|nr:toll/interleukin-1 receptor domain-containing protein [Nitrospirota bacterium]